MTTKKQPNKQPKKAPLAAKAEAESKAPETETPQPTTTSEQQTEAPKASAAGSAFSAADVAEINEELGIEEAVTEGANNPSSDMSDPTSNDSSSGVSGASGDDEGDIRSNPHRGSVDTSNVVSFEEEKARLAAEEEKAREMFYQGIAGGLNFANGRMTRKSPFGKFKSLDLDQYGPVSREATNQLFDRICEVPLFKKWLLKINDNVLMEKWGAIMMLAYSMYASMKQEQAQRFEVLKQKQAEAEQEQAA